MINTKRVLLIIFIILIPLLSISSSVYLLLKKNQEVKGVSIVNQETGCTPYITNMLPNVAYINREYIFYPRIVGCSIKEADIQVEGVEWLMVTNEKYVYGIPTVTDVGTYKIKIVVEGTGGSSELIDYIIVK